MTKSKSKIQNYLYYQFTFITMNNQQQQQQQYHPFLQPGQLANNAEHDIDFACSVNCLQVELEKEGKSGGESYECEIEIEKKKLLAYSKEKQELLWGFELCLCVSYSQEKGIKKCAQKQFHNNKIWGIKFAFFHKSKQIYLTTKSHNAFKELSSILATKTIFRHDFKENFLPHKKLYREPSFIIAKHKLTDSKFKVKMFNIPDMESSTTLKKQFHNEFTVHKEHSFPHVVSLINVYTSINSIYMVFQNTECSLEEYILTYGYPNLQDKKIIIKTVLEFIQAVHLEERCHRNISVRTIFLKETKNEKYQVKVGRLEECTVVNENDDKKRELDKLRQFFHFIIHEKFHFQKEKQYEEDSQQKVVDEFFSMFTAKNLDQILHHDFLLGVESPFIKRESKVVDCLLL